MSTLTKSSLVILATLAAACTVDKTAAPPLAGPSELGLRLNLQAVPDSIFQDGASQSIVQIDASGPDGRPSRGLPLRIEIVVDGVVQDFGTLSTKTVVTGEDGRARVTYTAPPRPAEPVDFEATVTIRVTPIGNDYTADVRRTVLVRLVTPGVLLPPNPGPPVPQFSFTPPSPAVLTNVVFDASATQDDGAQCGVVCTYAWDFGDGGTGTGIFATYQYTAPGTYQVRLTARDARGASASVAQPITVGGGTPPTALFTFSPSAPAVSQEIFFTAEGSRAATGRRIVSYDWNFGSGRTGTGISISKGYDVAGTYTVTLTVTDDAGLKGTVQQTVTVGAQGTGIIPALTVSPSSGTTTTVFFFDARGSTGPSPISGYTFTFGDGSVDYVSPSGSAAFGTATYRFAAAGTYTVSVRVRDAANRTALARVTITVQ
ncbi:MAG: PKD domain-containing protein [Acidobacteriota bacterium]